MVNTLKVQGFSHILSKKLADELLLRATMALSVYTDKSHPFF